MTAADHWLPLTARALVRRRLSPAVKTRPPARPRLVWAAHERGVGLNGSAHRLGRTGGRSAAKSAI